jgi:hypothetical protein
MFFFEQFNFKFYSIMKFSWFLSLGLFVILQLLVCKNLLGQINFNENFNTAPIGWIGNITHTTQTSACGSGSMRRNLFFPSAQSGNMVSPMVGTSVSGLVTLTYKYKIADWIANTVGTANWGSFNVQYGPSATGPWTTVQTINTGNHIVSGSCSTVSINFVPPAGNLFLKWDASWSGGDYFINFDDITVSETSGTACSGVPAPGNTLVDVDSSCTGQPFTLSLQNSTTGAGVSYEWQSADDATFTNNLVIMPATTFSVVASQSTPKYYRCVVTCGGLSATSNAAYVAVKSFTNCYCVAIPTSIDDFGITNILFGTFSNLNLGEDEYQNFKNLPPATILTSSNVPITCSLETGYSYRVWAFIDFNQNGSFSDIGEGFDLGLSAASPTASVSGNIVVPASAMLGNTGLRIVGTDIDLNTSSCYNSDFGNVEDYIINIAPNTLCSGTPNPGNIISSLISPLCNSNQGVTLSLQNETIGTGVTYQWCNSSGPIFNANSATFETGPLTNADSFYCVVGCGSLFATSAILPVVIAPPIAGSSVINPIIIGQAPCLSNKYSDIKYPTFDACYNNLLPINSPPEVYYQFSLLSPAIVQISNCGSGFDTYITLLDSNGAIITFADDNGPLCGGAAASLVATLSSGTYLIASEGYSATGFIHTTISTVDSCIELFTTSENVTCNGLANGSMNIVATPAANYTYSYVSDNGVTDTSLTGSFSNLPPSIYTVSASNGVYSSSSILIVSEPTALNGSVLLNTPPICNNGSDGIIMVSAINGTPFVALPTAYHYSWFKVGDSVNIIDTDSVLNNVLPADHFVIIEDANACKVTVNSVLINPPLLSSVVFDTICSNNLPYNWNGNIYNLAGTFIDTFAATNIACDSIVTLNLFVLNATSNTLYDTACNSYAWIINGNTYTASGIYYDTSINANGCQHIEILHLFIKLGTSSVNIISANNAYTWPVNNFTYLSSGIYINNSINGNGCIQVDSLILTITPTISLAIKATLSGPYSESQLLMKDDLRVKGLIPLIEPYSSSPYSSAFVHVNGGGETTNTLVLAQTGNDAIVDWVFVSIRSMLNSSVVLATKSALLQRDGDIVEASDGISPVNFSLLAGNYFVAVDHRNHLGIMTANPISIGTVTASINLTNGLTPLYLKPTNNNPTPLTGATKNQGGVRTMYSGNCSIASFLEASRINYGAALTSDKSALLLATGATTIINGYSIFDLDLNGIARYSGLNPDRFVISSTVLNTNSIIVSEQLP